MKVMAAMSLKDRLSMLEAYPRLEEFGQSSALKTRVVTTSDSNMSKKDLERVLDLAAKEIQVSVDSLRSRLVLNVVRLMPNLQEVTLKSCTFSVSDCGVKKRCRDIKVKHAAFLDCRVWKALARRVKSLEIDSCKTQGKHNINMSKECWRYLFSNYFFSRDPANTLEKIIFKNTEMSFHTNIGPYTIETAEVENLAGESLNLRELVLPNHYFCKPQFQLLMYLNLLCFNDEIGRPCRKIEFKRDLAFSVAHFKITDDFDMDKKMLKIANAQDMLASLQIN